MLMERRPHEGFVEGVYPLSQSSSGGSFGSFQPVEKVQCENKNANDTKTSTFSIHMNFPSVSIASEILLLLGVSWEIPGAQRNRRLYNFAEAVLLGVVQVCCEARFGKGIVPKKTAKL